MRATAKALFDLFNPTAKGGRWRVAALAFVVILLLRIFINPELTVFRIGEAGNNDYMAMIALSALLIALDAMLLVILSWNHLRDWKDALIVAGLVGLTHVFFPLITFAATAALAIGTEAGLSPILAGCAQTAIYLVAFAFIAVHLRGVDDAVRETDPDRLEPAAPLTSWVGIKQIWPAVFAVSIDALIVGPAKVAFMARYSPAQFMLSFVYIGLLVFVLVGGSGFVVLAIKRATRRNKKIVHLLDCIGSLLQVPVFIQFCVFAGVYAVYTVIETEWLLATEVIWGIAIVLAVLYFTLICSPKEIISASRQRAELTKIS